MEGVATDEGDAVKTVRTTSLSKCQDACDSHLNEWMGKGFLKWWNLTNHGRLATLSVHSVIVLFRCLVKDEMKQLNK